MAVGSLGSNTKDSGSELQLAEKPSESPLNKPSTDLAQDTADEDASLPLSHLQQHHDSNQLDQNKGSQQAGAEQATRDAVKGSTSPLGRTQVTQHTDKDVTSRSDIEKSQDLSANIPAAHNLRALSAGECADCAYFHLLDSDKDSAYT